MKRLIVTADDFGLALEVNEAVETAHKSRVLSAASLMVAGPAATDAVARARRMPRLRVGLHLALVDGPALLSREEAPNLVDGDGHLRIDLARFGWEIAVRPAVRRQVRAEIEAQFKAFRATCLPLDHVSAHKHYHLHPVIAHEMLSVGQAYGMKGVRVPIEPSRVLAAVEPGRKPSPAWIMAPWAGLLARKLSRAGLWSPDAVFGLAWSGQMTTARVARLINRLPAGCSEIYLHPAIRGGFPFSAPEYRYADELAALTAAETAAAVHSGDIALGGYADFLPAACGRL